MHYMRINFATQGLTGAKRPSRGGSKVVGVNNAADGFIPLRARMDRTITFTSQMTSRANPDHWDRLLKITGREDLIGDKRYLTPADRVAREPEVDDIIAAWTRQRTKQRSDAPWSARQKGIPAGAASR